MKKSLTLAVVLLTALAVAAPAAAYIVVMKDGSRIEAKDEYTIEDGKAIITLPNGTVTFVDAAEIDVEATRELNAAGYGRALVIDQGKARQRTEEDGEAEAQRRKTLADLVATREDNQLRLEPQRREEPERGTVTLVKTDAGFVDLRSVPRRPFRDVELASELQRFFRGQGIDNVELYQGTQPAHPFAEITTNSEASVFRALEIAAEALLAIQEDYSARVTGLELLLATPDRDRAGQFVLTPKLAQQLVGEEVEVTRFFVENVQF